MFDRRPSPPNTDPFPSLGSRRRGDGARSIVHLDMDAFFASVAQKDNEALRGRPVIVSGHSTRRGVVASCSYEARAFGVKSTMPLGEALSFCPQAVIVPVNMPRYRELSAELYALCGRFAPVVEPMGFEEAYLDLTGCESLQGPPQAVAQALQQAVQQQLGMSCSVGGGSSKLVAKIGSDRHKPGGFCWVPAGEEAAWLAPLPLSTLPGVGYRTGAALRERGLNFVWELLSVTPEVLSEALGPMALDLRALAQGIDLRPVRPPAPPKTMGSARTFDFNLESGAAIRTALHQLAGDLGFRLRQAGLLARHLSLTIRGPSFEELERGQKLDRAHDGDEALAEAALALWAKHAPQGRVVRLLGLKASRFVTVHEASWLDPPEAEAKRHLNEALDRLRVRFGAGTVTRAAHLPQQRRG